MHCFSLLPLSEKIWSFRRDYEATLQLPYTEKAKQQTDLVASLNDHPNLAPQIIRAFRLDVETRMIANTILTTFIAALRDQLKRTVNPDSTVTQVLRQTAVEEAVIKVNKEYSHSYQKSYKDYPLPLSDDGVAIWTAVALHGIASPDAPWLLNADGDVERTFSPDNPLRGRPHTLPPLAMGLPYGDSVHVVAWCMVPARVQHDTEARDALGFITVVGNHKKNRALWATLVDAKSHKLNLPSHEITAPILLGSDLTFTIKYNAQRTPAQRFLGNGQYATYINDVPLPSQLATMSILQRAAMYPRSGVEFLHVTGMDGNPNLALFWKQIDIACPLPLRPEWVEQLWELGIKYSAILNVPSWGCQGYWVKTDLSLWSKIIKVILTGNDDGVADPIVFGQSDEASDVAIQRSEDDDDDESDDD